MQHKRALLTRLGVILPMLMAVLLSVISLDSSAPVAKAASLPANTSWAVVLCRLSDGPPDFLPASYYNDLFTLSGAGKGGVTDYWHDMSYGTLSLNNTVVKGPYTIKNINTALASVMSDTTVGGACITEAINEGAFSSQYYGMIAVLNTPVIASTYKNIGDVYSLYPGQPYKTYPIIQLNSAGINNVATVTTLMQKAYNDNGFALGFPQNANAYAPTYPSWYFGQSGPALSGPQRDRLGLIPGSSVQQICASSCASDTRFDLVSLAQTPTPGVYSLAKVYRADHSYYAIEFRPRSGWDTGASSDSVRIHLVQADGSFSEVANPNTASVLWHAGEGLSDYNNNLIININGINGVASLEVSWTGGSTGGGGSAGGGGGGSTGSGGGGHPGCCREQ